MPPETKAEPDKEKPHYLGHRQRLRERLLKSGAGSLQDYELLELLLCLALPRIDVKPIAKNLISRFGSFAAVMAAEPEQLMEVSGIKENTAAAIKTVQAAAILMQKQDVLKNPVLSSWRAVLDYCHSIMANEKNEQFRLLFLDGKNALIADEVQSQGTVNHAPVYVREVVKRTLAHGAVSIIMAHNHPTGDPTPSRDDIEMTRAVQRALAEIGVSVHDHIIIGRKGHASLRSLGYMDAAKAAR
ncbi:DNA repair protein RadC [Dongia mobilis]|uniref:DNA repair protein RadC n=1 Tax=Dongia mobilis TaxID=578943 RepID=A0A4R6WJY1_9PROT|nr:DNA repair protein RadC [Dongia mobilis]TDQ80816.1 DNA repair protein RadC [Dongia mobilis]